MSGHSKWSTIKRKKGKADAERGKLFTKLIKEITVAARSGGGDADANPRLRTAIAAAKSGNMPVDNIRKAIMKGTGELPGVNYEEISYEGYGPGGAAVFVEALTDNKNRTVAEIRHLFGKYNGNLGESGCVAWIFERTGLIEVEKALVDEETLMDLVLEAGATDMTDEGETWLVKIPPEGFNQVHAALESKSIAMISAEITRVPQNTVKLEGRQAESMIKLFELLDDHEDVQKAHSNFDIDDELLEKLTA